MAKPKFISEEIKMKSKKEKKSKDESVPHCSRKIKCFKCSEEGHKSFERPLNVAMVARTKLVSSEIKQKTTYLLDSGV